MKGLCWICCFEKICRELTNAVCDIVSAWSREFTFLHFDLFLLIAESIFKVVKTVGSYDILGAGIILAAS